MARLATTTPANLPDAAIEALHTPNALIAARVALAGAIQSGFFFMLAASVVAFICSFLMVNINLDGSTAPTSTNEHGGEIVPVPAEQDIGH